MNTPTSNAVTSTAKPLSIPARSPKSSLIALGSLLRLSCEECALAIRDQVNSISAGRLELRNISMGPSPLPGCGQKAVLFFLDTCAPSQYWDDIEGACMTIEWEAGVHSIEQTVQHILNDTPEV